jgi:hypothetical protein
MRTMFLWAVALSCVVGQAVLCVAADPPETGKSRDTLIYARTEPPGAKVFVNGKELGTTPGLFPADAGVVTIILQLEGHGQVKKEIRIPAHEITRIEIELKPRTHPPASQPGQAQTPEATIPAIVSTTPPVAAQDVDPAITELRVTFSEPMAEGFSWTGGGPDYPPTTGSPHWTEDHKTCILPVKLEAAHYYRVGINSTSFQNFRSAAGVPARPSAIYFTTKGASDEMKARLQKPQIVAMTPANGAKDVDPATTELRVTFNVPMGGGFSWTGGGSNHPEVTGHPYWTEDRKTCVLPVKLKPNWDYMLGLNSPSHKNFQSESGIPLEPVRYQFSTRAAAESKGNPQSQSPVKYGNLTATLVAANARATALEMLRTAAVQVDEPDRIGQLVPSKPADAFTAQLSFTATGGSAPRIVSVSPRVGADNVDPATSEIVVTFSQKMAGGFSWTGGGPDYPPIPEGKKPFWRNDRTCVLPVKLEEGRYYRVGINSKSFLNFRSAAGVPVRPSAVYFVTKGASDEVKSRLQKPRVVTISPANGAKDVDPATTEIRVTFNVPMGGGFSWTGGGPNYPKTTGSPSWSEDRKTCILPVELQPGWSYQLGLNSPSHNNFQSESGIPLEPVRYRFTTRGHAAK